MTSPPDPAADLEAIHAALTARGAAVDTPDPEHGVLRVRWAALRAAAGTVKQVAALPPDDAIVLIVARAGGGPEPHAADEWIAELVGRGEAAESTIITIARRRLALHPPRAPRPIGRAPFTPPSPRDPRTGRADWFRKRH